MATDTINDDKAGPAVPEAQLLALDRRRAGRQQVNATLVPLLRDPANGTAALDQTDPLAETPYRADLESDPFHDQLAPARGILLGLFISMLFWGALGYAVFR